LQLRLDAYLQVPCTHNLASQIVEELLGLRDLPQKDWSGQKSNQYHDILMAFHDPAGNGTLGKSMFDLYMAVVWHNNHRKTTVEACKLFIQVTDAEKKGYKLEQGMLKEIDAYVNGLTINP